jgi:hypothetical protein
MLRKFRPAETAKITRVRIDLSAICALNHKRLASYFQNNFYAPAGEKFLLTLIKDDSLARFDRLVTSLDEFD